MNQCTPVKSTVKKVMFDMLKTNELGHITFRDSNETVLMETTSNPLLKVERRLELALTGS